MEANLKVKAEDAEIGVHSGGGSLYPVMKRVVDVVLSLTLIAITLPLWGWIALSIKLTSPGPIIFRQKRIGTGGREFVIYKFRTMVDGADADQNQQEFGRYASGEPLASDEHGPLFKQIADPRTTRVGRFLRAVNLDELPQLVNVLNGQMSIVGPRPMVPYQLGWYKPWYYQRHQVPQGITGLWQLKGRNRVDLDNMVLLDLEYISTRSLWLDLWLIVLTIPGMLRAPQRGTGG